MAKDKSRQKSLGEQYSVIHITRAWFKARNKHHKVIHVSAKHHGPFGNVCHLGADCLVQEPDLDQQPHELIAMTLGSRIRVLARAGCSYTDAISIWIDIQSKESSEV